MSLSPACDAIVQEILDISIAANHANKLLLAMIDACDNGTNAQWQTARKQYSAYLAFFRTL